MGAILDEVVGLDVVCTLRPQADAGPVRQPKTTSLRLQLRPLHCKVHDPVSSRPSRATGPRTQRQGPRHAGAKLAAISEMPRRHAPLRRHPERMTADVCRDGSNPTPPRPPLRTTAHLSAAFRRVALQSAGPSGSDTREHRGCCWPLRARREVLSRLMEVRRVACLRSQGLRPPGRGTMPCGAGRTGPDQWSSRAWRGSATQGCLARHPCRLTAPGQRRGSG